MWTGRRRNPYYWPRREFRDGWRAISALHNKRERTAREPVILLTNPFAILGTDNDVTTELGVTETTKFSLADIVVLLKAVILYGGIIMALGSLILLLFIRNNDRLFGEHKERVTRILTIIWLAESSVTIFNILKTFFDSIFGF